MRAVLTFHSVDDSGSVLSFAPRLFASLIEGLAAANVPVLPYPALLKSEHGVALTFDDGMASVHRHALPVLAAHKMPAHLFLTTGVLGKDNHWLSQPSAAPHFDMLSWHQVEACAAKGMLFEAHTESHPDLRALSDSDIVAECQRADATIVQRLGRAPRLFAYPYGRSDPRVRKVVGGLYEACFSTRLAYLPRLPAANDVPRLDSYFLRDPRLHGSLFSPSTRAYIALRAAIRALRGKA